MNRLLTTVLLVVYLVSCNESTRPTTENPIVAENKLPGSSDWLINVKPDTCSLPNHRFCRRPEIEGYCSRTSVNAGETIQFYISTNPVSAYSMSIYRMGYYGGKGASMKLRLDTMQGITQAEPQPDPKTNYFESKWTESYRLTIPANWVSGVYVCKMVTQPGNFQAYMIFIVKDKRQTDFVFQCSDLTWQAYNRWPYWHSMYDEGHQPWINTNGAQVSFDRPYGIYVNELPSAFNPLSNGAGEFLLWEYPLCYWMEKEGYDVSYISNIDTHADSSTLFRTKAFLSVGHDEYWTYKMFNHVQDARDRGVNLLFLSGNSVDGTQWLGPSSDGRPNRSTGRLPEREFKNEQDLMGSTSYGVGFGNFICQAPDHWLFANTGMKKGDSIPNLVGWEYHGLPTGNHKNIVTVAETAVDPVGFGDENPEHYAATLYTTPKGNFVFNAATCWWVQPLARTPAYQHPRIKNRIVDFSNPDNRVEQMTKNLFEHVIAGSGISK